MTAVVLLIELIVKGKCVWKSKHLMWDSVNVYPCAKSRVSGTSAFNVAVIARLTGFHLIPSYQHQFPPHKILTELIVLENHTHCFNWKCPLFDTRAESPPPLQFQFKIAYFSSSFTFLLPTPCVVMCYHESAECCSAPAYCRWSIG